MSNLEQTKSRLSPDQGASRRQMLVSGALLGGIEPARAAAAAPQALPQKHEVLQVALTPLRSNGVLWARHEWHFGLRFAGKQPPTVIATAADDYMDNDVTSTCTCSVLVQGKPGAYHAVILVRGIHARAASVQIHAVAVGD